MDHLLADVISWGCFWNIELQWFSSGIVTNFRLNVGAFHLEEPKVAKCLAKNCSGLDSDLSWGTIPTKPKRCEQKICEHNELKKGKSYRLCA